MRARNPPNARPEREAGKLLTEAEDCELIGKLATDLRSMAHDIQAMISTRKQETASHTIKAFRMVPKAAR